MEGIYEPAAVAEMTPPDEQDDPDPPPIETPKPKRKPKPKQKATTEKDAPKPKAKSKQKATSAAANQLEELLSGLDDPSKTDPVEEDEGGLSETA